MKQWSLAILSCALLASSLQTCNAASLSDLKSLVEGVYVLDEWTIDGKTYKPPAIEGRSVFMNGHVITVLNDTTKETKKTYDTLLGEYSLTSDFFTYQYVSRSEFNQSLSNIALSRALPFDGKSRDFTVKQDDKAVHMQYQNKSSLDFTAAGLVYSIDGKVTRVWRRAKPD